MKKTKTREHCRHIHLALRADNNLNNLFEEGAAVAFLCPRVQKGCPSKRSCLPVATFNNFFLGLALLSTCYFKQAVASKALIMLSMSVSPLWSPQSALPACFLGFLYSSKESLYYNAVSDAVIASPTVHVHNRV